ncbi:MAG: transporter [Sphingomonas sp.]|nr:transporter [Sphingomonas sp.]
MKMLVAALVAAALVPHAARAQENVAPPPTGAALTLDEAHALALEVSPDAEAVAESIRAAEVGAQVAGLRPNPTAFAEVENFAGTGAFGGVGAAEATVGIELPIERGGKREARVAVARARTAGARLSAAEAAAELRIVVTLAYAGAIAAERRLATAEETLRIAQETAAAADARVRAGAASPLEQERAAVVLANAEAGVAIAQRRLSLSRAQLGRLIGRPLAEPLADAWFDRVTGYGPRLSVAIDGTLALARARSDLDIAEAQIDLADAQRVPDLTLRAGIRRAQDADAFGPVIGVSLPLRIFNNGSASLRQARAERDAAAARVHAAALRAQQAISEAQADVADAEITARTALGPALSAAQEALRIARIGYREGKFSQLDLIEAERTLADTRNAAIDAVYQYHAAVARLERLTAAYPTGGDR